jgi:HEAT repeat protein
MTPEQELVKHFGFRGREIGALQALTGGITATHARNTPLTEAAFTALVEGLSDPHPPVRWWCVQILDHATDVRAVSAIAALLDDPVPRVRRVAAHALGCVTCKPEWDGALPPDIEEKLTNLAMRDPNMKVRRHAAWALTCRAELSSSN